LEQYNQKHPHYLNWIGSEIQLNLAMSNLVYSKFSLIQNFLKSRFKLSALQLILLLLHFVSQILMCRNFGFLEVIFCLKSLIDKSIQFFSLCQNYKSNQLIKPVKVSTAWPPVFTASGEIYFDNCFNYHL
jgi:hypothetical protein